MSIDAKLQGWLSSSPCDNSSKLMKIQVQKRITNYWLLLIILNYCRRTLVHNERRVAIFYRIRVSIFSHKESGEIIEGCGENVVISNQFPILNQLSSRVDNLQRIYLMILAFQNILLINIFKINIFLGEIPKIHQSEGNFGIFHSFSSPFRLSP